MVVLSLVISHGKILLRFDIDRTAVGNCCGMSTVLVFYYRRCSGLIAIRAVNYRFLLGFGVFQICVSFLWMLPEDVGA